jgi:hypothetical protein
MNENFEEELWEQARNDPDFLEDDEDQKKVYAFLITNREAIFMVDMINDFVEGIEDHGSEDDPPIEEVRAFARKFMKFLEENRMI